MDALDQIFEASAKKWGVPKKLLTSIAKVESNFNPNAVSEKNAQGMMQFMPETAKEMGLKDPFDAAQSIDAAGHYLSKLHQQLGNWDKTTLAYNQGAGNVLKGKIGPAGHDYYNKVLNTMNGGNMPLPDGALEIQKASIDNANKKISDNKINQDVAKSLLDTKLAGARSAMAGGGSEMPSITGTSKTGGGSKFNLKDLLMPILGAVAGGLFGGPTGAAIGLAKGYYKGQELDVLKNEQANKNIQTMANLAGLYQKNPLLDAQEEKTRAEAQALQNSNNFFERTGDSMANILNSNAITNSVTPTVTSKNVLNVPGLTTVVPDENATNVVQFQRF